MNANQREAQLYGAFLQSIKSAGIENLKKTTLFIRNVDRGEQVDQKAA